MPNDDKQKWIELRAGHGEPTKHGYTPVFLVRADGSKALRFEQDGPLPSTLLELEELESLVNQLKRLEIKGLVVKI